MSEKMPMLRVDRMLMSQSTWLELRCYIETENDDCPLLLLEWILVFIQFALSPPLVET